MALTLPWSRRPPCVRTPVRPVCRVAVLLACLAMPPLAAAQTTGVVRGTVFDPQGARVAGATVAASSASSGLERRTTSGPDGAYELVNLPLASYDVLVEAPGFAITHEAVVLHSNVPVVVDVTLSLADRVEAVTVRPSAPLADPTGTGTVHAVSTARIERLPTATSSRGLEAVLVSFPGFAQNANGAIHPRGAHNQMTFVIDGLPISDQLTGAFANSLDASVVQSAELITGNVPAEFGGKVSGVAVLTSRTGLGVGQPVRGSISASVGDFDTVASSVQVGGEHGRTGYFVSASAMHTDRYLDQVSLDNLHNAGGSARGFARVDANLSDRDRVRLHVMGGRARFELANLRSQHAAGQDQRQQLGDLSTWASYLRTIDATSTLEATVGSRTTTAVLNPSPGDTPVTAAQNRRLSTLTAAARYSLVAGRQVIRVGLDLQRFPVSEWFSMGITSPTFNEPGTAGYNEKLLAHDLTRGGAPFVFEEARTGTLASGFAQATLQRGQASLSLGLRHDTYRFLVHGWQLQPRVGLAYQVPRTDLVLRASYNRTYQTPPNENLLLSNSEAASRLAPSSVSDALGGTYRPIRPQREHVYEAGARLPLGRLGTLDLAVYRKDAVDQQDNNNFFDTGIIFPTALARIDVVGAEGRVTVQGRRGLAGTVSVTAGRARSTPPFTGGLFVGQDAVDLLSSGPFLIDHDQRLAIHGTLSYDPSGPFWLGASVRYDSGLVSNPSDPRDVAADPDAFDLLPYVDLGATVPRVRARTILDLGVGLDLARRDGRRTWTAAVQVTNVTNRTALYSFQSVFVGTRLVQPRTLALRVARHF